MPRKAGRPKKSGIKGAAHVSEQIADREAMKSNWNSGIVSAKAKPKPEPQKESAWIGQPAEGFTERMRKRFGQ